MKDSGDELFPVHWTNSQQITNMPRQRQAYGHMLDLFLHVTAVEY